VRGPVGVRRCLGALAVVLALVACEPLGETDADGTGAPTPAPSTSTLRFESTTTVTVPFTTEQPTPASAPAPTRPAAAPRTAAPLLFAAAGGDGDSWKDRSGREYRLGLVNAPEAGECFGDRATARRKALVRSGFRARTYARDRYGRGVALVSLADGRNLNVLLAREGLADDRYLAEFRHENEPLARQLDAAFAEAKRAKRGLWGGCSTEQPQGFVAAPPPKQQSSCHPDYATCLPVKGDGSGAGQANDLDCGDIRQLVRLRRIGVDPYRLDGDDDDGLGCESYA
jgi:endonuclease YncB( thermonuclease family)